jgi:VWFA-related protein
MNLNNVFPYRKVVLFVLIVLMVTTAFGQKENEITILVTAMPHNERTRNIAEKLEPIDFAVYEDKKSQKIISSKKAGQEPIVLAVLIQDNLVSRVNNELGEIKNFILSLPENSKVMTAYISTGRLQVRQQFTTDKEKAAKSLRILLSSDIATPFSPYMQVVDALEMFNDQPKKARRMLLLVSDGLDDTFGFRLSSPSFSIHLDRTIREAQRQGVATFAIYAPSVSLRRFNRHAINYGQGSLLKLADETGGEAFFSGSDFVTFNPYFKDYTEMLNNQWLITYRSKSGSKGFRKIEVTTDFDIHLHHQAGYRLK